MENISDPTKNKETIIAFYTAFAKGNAEGMTKHYHDNVVFEDPAFGKLQGEKAKAMWHMLLSRAKGNLKIEFSKVQTAGNQVTANWIADYPYGKSKRRVINKVKATFEFNAGKIVSHKDEFNLWRWSKQALGLSGWLFGWSNWLKAKVQKQTNQLLNTYLKQ